jgi:hypothetical protein
LFIKKSVNSVNVLIDYLIATNQTTSDKTANINEYCARIYKIIGKQKGIKTKILNQALSITNKLLRNPPNNATSFYKPISETIERTPIQPRERKPLTVIDKTTGKEFSLPTK